MVANTVGFLATGVKDGLLLSAYSSEMNDTFVMPRIVPATAFIAKESEAATQNSRRSFNSDETNSCSNIQRQDSENTDTIFKQISEAVQADNIPAELIVNIDQTPLPFVLISKYTMNKTGEKSVPVLGMTDWDD